MSNTRKKTIRQIMDEMPSSIHAQTKGISYYINRGFFNIFDYDENTKIENSDTLVFFKSEIIENQRSTQYWEYDPHSKTLEPFSFKAADQEVTPQVSKKISSSVNKNPSSLTGTKASYTGGSKTSFTANTEIHSPINMNRYSSIDTETSTSANILSANKPPSFSWPLFSKIVGYGVAGIACGFLVAIALGLGISALSTGILIPFLVAAGAGIGIYIGIKMNCNSTAPGPLDSSSSTEAEAKPINIAGSTHQMASRIEGIKKISSENSSQPDLKGFSVSKTEQKYYAQGVSRNLDPSNFQQTKTIKNR